MRKVSLFNNTLVTSKLGYGTSLLMARLNARESARLLEEAFENGITHFDTARSYGYGEAESIVGRFVRNKRDRVTVTTKAGILPPKRSRALRALRMAARAAVQVMPGLRKTIRAQAGKMVSAGNFDVPSVRRSLEMSLRELRIETIDCFLLHDCAADDLSEDLLAYLQRVMREGKIRRFGVATHAHDAQEIVRLRSAFADLVQVPHALGWVQAADDIVQRVPGGLFTHSISSGDLNGIVPPEAMRQAILDYAVHANPKGVVLFSSTKPRNIAANVRMVSTPRFSAHELEEIKRRVEQR